MESLLMDVRYGLRSLVAKPSFTIIAVMALALGIGANTAIFSLVNGVLLKPLPYKEPSKLVRIWEKWGGFDRGSVSYLNFVDWRDQNKSFEKMATYRWAGYNLSGGQEPERIFGRTVSAEFLSVLGVSPALGRDFAPEEDRLGASLAAIISDGLWKRRFGADRNVIGRNITIDETPHTIVGVMSRGFQFHVAYTWGKSIDTLSATAADDSFPNGLFNQLFFDQRTTRGLSDFDVAQTAVVSFTWELPSPTWGASTRHSGRAAPLRLLELPSWALGGWQLGGLYKISTGQPFTPTLGGDPVGQKLEETNVPPDWLAGPGCMTLTNPGNPNHYIKTQCLAFPVPGNTWGTLGRNTLIGPGLSKLDFSLFKNNYVRRISESFNAQLRVEIFNILNRANFASPTSNTTVFDQHGQPISSAGLITSTQTTSRQIQFALKIIW